MKRLFLGIELPEDAREGVAALQSRLREVATRQGVRFVRPEKIHLTLVFLGPVPDDAIPAIDTACAPVCARHLALNLVAKGLGGFPHLQRPKVLWAGIEGDLERLTALQTDLAVGLSEWSEPEAKGYSPHLTLARISPGSKEVGWLAGNVANEFGDGDIAGWTVTEVTLFESTPDGQYLPLARWPLASATPEIP